MTCCSPAGVTCSYRRKWLKSPFYLRLPNELYAVSTQRELSAPFSKRRDPECSYQMIFEIIFPKQRSFSIPAGSAKPAAWQTDRLSKFQLENLFFFPFLFVIDPNSRFSMVTLSPQTERQKSNQVVRLVTLPQFRQLEPKSGSSQAPKPSVSVVWKHLVNSRVAFYSSCVAFSLKSSAF